MGPNGETILVAVDRRNRIRGWRVVRVGENHVQTADELWDALDGEDPVPILVAI